ncbi:alpha/beta hydrolase [Nocardioides panacisoli]|uniref:alpha/beta hydrolase n=1 Tax=Nocardioides panacisoli TaxID=627624 RepID=UPI001C629B62|nr:alpha/beta hydrolase [Nocardioides panacisoli]QYJ03115.1 alpha/beta hydrolase [Nocardioides panacisoli]
MKKLIVATTTVWVLVVAAALSAGVLVLRAEDSSADPVAGEDNASEGSPDELAEFYEQEIAWESCGGGEWQCGDLTVPVDYADPDGETIDLALSRARASGSEEERVGSLVVNPGGPGAPGTDMVEGEQSLNYYFRPELQAAYDIVGFDPRGTGESSPIDCLSDEQLDGYLAEDQTPDDPGEREEYFEASDAFWAGCEDNTGELLGHVSTSEVARDMDVLRSALAEEQLHYLGFSYGTRLGSYYAELFPENVGRFVLDSAVNPELDFIENSMSQAQGFARALQSYVQACVDGNECFLGDSVEEGLQRIDALLEQVDDDPLPTQQGRELEPGYAVLGLITPLYSEDNWPLLDQGLQQAFNGDGSTLLALADFYASREEGAYTDNSVEAIAVINCLDDPSAIEQSETEDYIDQFREVSPTIGEMWAWGLSGCGGLPVEPAEEPLDGVTAAGAEPIVVIGTTKDPATPYEEAEALADQLESGVLLTREGDGHGGYTSGNDCIADAVHQLLVDGEAPADGTTC